MNTRQGFRLRKHMDVAWSIPAQKNEGNGRIFNISLLGMMFTTDRLFVPEHGLKIHFRVEQIPVFPAEGKLVWFSRKAAPRVAYYQCGVKFLDEEAFSPAWNKWMDENILKLADTANNTILMNYLREGQQEE